MDIVEDGLEYLGANEAEWLLADVGQHLGRALQPGLDQPVLVDHRRGRVGGHHGAQAPKIYLRILRAARVPDVPVLVPAIAMHGHEAAVLRQKLLTAPRLPYRRNEGRTVGGLLQQRLELGLVPDQVRQFPEVDLLLQHRRAPRQAADQVLEGVLVLAVVPGRDHLPQGGKCRVGIDVEGRAQYCQVILEQRRLGREFELQLGVAELAQLLDRGRVGLRQLRLDEMVDGAQRAKGSVVGRHEAYPDVHAQPAQDAERGHGRLGAPIRRQIVQGVAPQPDR